MVIEPRPVLSEDDLRLIWETADPNWIDKVRAVERAVLEVVGGPYPTGLLKKNADLRARVAELERDVDERSREIGEVMQVNERLAKERDAALRENAELREDRDRLDWMERWADRATWNEIAIESRDGAFCGVNFGNSQHRDVWDPTCEHVGETVRAAIDAAREENAGE